MKRRLLSHYLFLTPSHGLFFSGKPPQLRPRVASFIPEGKRHMLYQSIKGEKGKETSRSPTDLQQEADMPPLEMTNNLVGFDSIN
jgi:hypothetical protein